MAGSGPQSNLTQLPVLSAVQQLTELLALNASIDAVRDGLDRPFAVTATAVTELPQPYDRAGTANFVAVPVRATELSRAVTALRTGNPDCGKAS